jgi:hypothetical protein
MKAKVMLLVAASLILASLAQAQEGRGRASGGNIGCNGEIQQILTTWCASSMDVLATARMQAQGMYAQGYLPEAVTAYRQGLIEAMQKDISMYAAKTLTRRVIERALELDDSLVCVSYEDRYNMLSMYYGFVEFVANRVDIPVFVPYMTGGHGIDEVLFEARFKEFAVAELRFVLDNFTGKEANGRIFPKYSTGTYLMLLERFARYAAYDLSDSLLVARYACAISTLNALAEQVAHYNAGNKRVYGGDVMAVQMTAREIERIANSLQRGCGK